MSKVRIITFLEGNRCLVTSGTARHITCPYKDTEYSCNSSCASFLIADGHGLDSPNPAAFCCAAGEEMIIGQFAENIDYYEDLYPKQKTKRGYSTKEFIDNVRKSQIRAHEDKLFRAEYMDNIVELIIATAKKVEELCENS